MNRTDTLLRLKRFRVDEMKRRVSSIEAMRADLDRKLADSDDDNVAREKQRAGDSDIGRLAFPSFLRSIETRRENLRATLKEIEREYAAAQGDLTSAFQDLKSAGSGHRTAGQTPGRDPPGAPPAGHVWTRWRLVQPSAQAFPPLTPRRGSLLSLVAYAVARATCSGRKTPCAYEGVEGLDYEWQDGRRDLPVPITAAKKAATIGRHRVAPDH